MFISCPSFSEMFCLAFIVAIISFHKSECHFFGWCQFVWKCLDIQKACLTDQLTIISALTLVWKLKLLSYYFSIYTTAGHQYIIIWTSENANMITDRIRKINFLGTSNWLMHCCGWHFRKLWGGNKIIFF